MEYKSLDVGTLTEYTAANDQGDGNVAIKTFKSLMLKELFETGESRRMDTKLVKRALGRMAALHGARQLKDLFIPGFELHKYPNTKSRYSISISGHWRITFDWDNNEAYNVDLSQPHG